MTDTHEEPTEPADDETSTAVRSSEEQQPDETVQDPAQSEEQEPETFPRSYVEELRQENGRYRQRAQQGDQYAQRLHTELVRATSRLADPTDLPFDAEHLADADKLAGAIDDLLTRKPHLANRRPTGDIGQGALSGQAANVDLAAIMRQHAQ